MPTVRGTIEQLTRQNGRTAIKIGDTWYSTFKPIGAVNKGDPVRLDYVTTTKNGKVYHNIERLVREQQAPTPAAPTSEQAHIARSVALKCAVESAGPGRDPTQVIETAEVFLAFLLPAEGQTGTNGR
jgi:hypothetical protein